LSPNVIRLGLASLLTAMSSAMVYGLLPVFLVKVLEAGTASLGLIEGMSERADWARVGSAGSRLNSESGFPSSEANEAVAWDQNSNA
jgi:hypothetical protein